MATKSEDVRLQMNNVRYKKGDGTLYLMAERLGWMPNNKNNFTISHKYSDIKMQKISPEGKAKIQLQIVLHTGDATTFQFMNLEDRTAVKDALLQILPLFKGVIPKDREKKALLLSKNPHLLQLYKDLVETKIVSVEDFWSQFVCDQEEDIELQCESQEVGVSADFLSGIPLNGKQVKGTVHVETLWAILKTYPKVAKKHQDLVPSKMTETEFWNKFFQSRYFNRDRTKDLFSDCAKSDEKELTAAVKSGNIDPFLDLDMFYDNAYTPSSDNPAPSSSHDNTDQILIKRFNQQSIRLLECLKRKEVTEAVKIGHNDSINSLNGEVPMDTSITDVKPFKNQIPLPVDERASSSFRANRRDWTYDDLAGHGDVIDFLEGQSQIGSKMNEIAREMYTLLPRVQQVNVTPQAAREHIEALKAWVPQLSNCISAKEATEALKNLSPAGYLMRSSQTNRLEDTVPEELQVKLRGVYSASNELLRHFWLCFPAVEPSLEAKLLRLHDTLKKFESSKLQSLYDSLPRDHRHLLTHIMRGQFKAATRKFDNWASKRRMRTR